MFRTQKYARMLGNEFRTIWYCNIVFSGKLRNTEEEGNRLKAKKSVNKLVSVVIMGLWSGLRPSLNVGTRRFIVMEHNENGRTMGTALAFGKWHRIHFCHCHSAHWPKSVFLLFFFFFLPSLYIIVHAELDRDLFWPTQKEKEGKRRNGKNSKTCFVAPTYFVLESQ